MRVLFLEPFHAGSHARFLDTLIAGLRGVQPTTLTLPGRHWKWRMRGAVPFWLEHHGDVLRARYDLVFTSSFVPLAELIGLVPTLASAPRVLYFHENQLAYPSRPEFSGERDHHFGFTQMVSALAATICVFNSEFNRDSFLEAGRALLARMPDARITGWGESVAARSTVLGVPMDLPAIRPEPPERDRRRGPVLLWNHRWEHDKGPDEFFDVLVRMRNDSVPFELIVCGEAFGEIPTSMRRAREELADRVLSWGFVPDRSTYLRWLGQADVAVSASRHEFFGLSMLEATWLGARPLVPDRLCYQEWFAEEFRYDDLETALRGLCAGFLAGEPLRADRRSIVEAFRAETLVPRYEALLAALVDGGA